MAGRPCLPLSTPFHSAGARGTIPIQGKQNVNLLKAALLCTEMVSVSKSDVVDISHPPP